MYKDRFHFTDEPKERQPRAIADSLVIGVALAASAVAGWFFVSDVLPVMTKAVHQLERVLDPTEAAVHCIKQAGDIAGCETVALKALADGSSEEVLQAIDPEFKNAPEWTRKLAIRAYDQVGNAARQKGY